MLWLLSLFVVPSQAITLERVIPTQRSNAEIRSHLQKSETWKEFTYGASESRLESSKEVVHISIPSKGISRSVNWIELRLKDLSPAGKDPMTWTVELVANSKNQIPSEISEVKWEFESNESRSTLKVKVSAEPHQWRTKLWALFLPKVLLNQLLYWDLEKLVGTEASRDPNLITITPER